METQDAPAESAAHDETFVYLGLVRMLYAQCDLQGFDSREVTNYLMARHRPTRNHADSFAVQEGPLT